MPTKRKDKIEESGEEKTIRKEIRREWSTMEHNGVKAR